MKKNIPELIVMLTHHDRTVENAIEVFESAKDAREILGLQGGGPP